MCENGIIASLIYMYVQYNDYVEDVQEQRALMFIPMHSMLQHNCDPNVGKVSKDGGCLFYALYPIKKGDQVIFFIEMYF